jgi:DNA polymerase I-like protein with 3'-5' exonuclease and polymerase domains
MRIYWNESSLMQKTVDLMNEFCYVLTQMERSGIAIDIETLDKLQEEYSKEQAELSEKLHKLAREALGDTPFKLTSSDDLSMIIYSRKPISKRVWADKFNLGSEFINGSVRPKRPTGMTPQKLGEAITTRSYVVQKTKASQCTTCRGTGKVSRKLKSGAWGKPHYNCNMCGGCGINYTPTGDVAGFKQAPSTVHDLAAHGYRCGKEILIRLAGKAKDEKAKAFLKGMVRLNAITSYLDTYIAGIRSHVGRDGILHTQFMQCVTATGRLSSRAPNFHNQPRGGTFPIRKVVVSRWKKGKITEGDYAQLEFRVAAALAKCDQAKADILDGIDIHQKTADILTEMGQKTTRQEAKEHTFKPLYGGTTGSKAEQAYYKWFSKRYTGIARWHKKILDLAVVYKRLTLPSGRIYKFPWCHRSAAGGISGATKIKNYPVQGFATADIVPMACTKLYHLMKEDDLKSLLINEVHDSIVVDTYPGEEDRVMSCMSKAMLGVIDGLDHRFNFTFNIPLVIEIKRGKNWLEMEKIFEG